MSKAKALDRLQLLTDQPIGEEQSTRVDGLDFDAYATVLARAAMGTPGPFTIGIFGEWGTGKTSLMRMIKSKLTTDEIVTVWFNAWQFEKEPHPIVPLVGSILQEIERNKAFRERLKDAGRGLMRSLRAIAYGFSASAEVEVPGFAKLEAGFVVKDMIDREVALTPDPLVERSLYYRAFETLASAPLPANARVVVIIDDLDRCFPDKAIRMLESIKLVLSQRGFIFVLGVARSVLEGYLQHRYRREYGLRHFDGSAYLDKIVQLAFPIPPHTGRMEGLVKKLILGVDPSQQNALSTVVPLVADHLGANPRSLVRFVNNLLIDVEISRLMLKEDVSLDFFAVTRCLQLRWRLFYDDVVLDRERAEFAANSTLDVRKTTAADVNSPFAVTAGYLVEDAALARLVQSKPCKAWLMQHETRERAVLFLQATLRNTELARLERDAYVLTLVAAEEPQAANSLMMELRKLERRYGAQHYTYSVPEEVGRMPDGNNDPLAGSVIAEVFERLKGRDSPGAGAIPVVRLLLFVGHSTKGGEVFRDVTRLLPDLRTMLISPPSAQPDTEREAKRVLASLYGSAIDLVSATTAPSLSPPKNPDLLER